MWLNPLAPQKLEWNFREVICKLILVIYGKGISWNCPQMNVTGPYWLEVNIVSGKGLVLRQQAITWANVDSDLHRYMVSPGHNALRLGIALYYRFGDFLVWAQPNPKVKPGDRTMWYFIDLVLSWTELISYNSLDSRQPFQVGNRGITDLDYTDHMHDFHILMFSCMQMKPCELVQLTSNLMFQYECNRITDKSVIPCVKCTAITEAMTTEQGEPC